MTAVPAEPVNPLIHLRDSQCSGTYSPECGSVLGTMNADSWRASISLRRAANLLFISVLIFMVFLLSEQQRYDFSFIFNKKQGKVL
jgi:hypothetical protein